VGGVEVLDTSPLTRKPLTLEQHRAQVLKNLKACLGSREVRELLADVQLMLVVTGVSSATQAAFWCGISAELDLESQRAMLVLQEETGKTLRNLIAAARTTIKGYQRLLAEADKPTPNDTGN
jgi:hypothetical protein